MMRKHRKTRWLRQFSMMLVLLLVGVGGVIWQMHLAEESAASVDAYQHAVPCRPTGSLDTDCLRQFTGHLTQDPTPISGSPGGVVGYEAVVQLDSGEIKTCLVDGSFYNSIRAGDVVSEG